jgi:D-glycero-D-manno-heptose 1,7-bisphosphate phosphatase
MAGGKGTRVAKVNSEIPKPMLPIGGKPVLEWQIECLERQGITDIILIVGYQGGVIKEHFGDSFRYITENEPLGTAGALWYLKKEIKDDFLLLNGDVIFDIDIDRFYQAHRKNNAVVTLFTHPNNHPYDSGIVIANKQHRVISWLTKEDKREWYKNRVNAGLHFLSPRIFEKLNTENPSKLDLDRDILKPMIAEETLFVYDSPEYVKDMGTPERIKETEIDIQAGKINAKNLHNKQKALFIDRDGTINKYIGFLRNIDEFELIPETVEIIKKANESGSLVIVVTNQPIIARGEVSWKELDEIHNKMETLLGEQGAYVDDIFICPHHPDKGFSGERPEYKIECDCRKPKPGLLLQAAEKYNIDIIQSIMLGDSEVDIVAGKTAGCMRNILYASNKLSRVQL